MATYDYDVVGFPASPVTGDYLTIGAATYIYTVKGTWDVDSPLTTSRVVGPQGIPGVSTPGTHLVDGWAYRSDSGLESTNLSVDPDLWTTLTNDGVSGSSNIAEMPNGVARVWDPALSQVKFDQLDFGASVILRVSIESTPDVNNSLIRVKLLWTARDSGGTALYTFEQIAGGQENSDGAGIVYTNMFVIPAFVGDQVSKDGEGILQVYSSSALEINDVKILSIVQGGA